MRILFGIAQDNWLRCRVMAAYDESFFSYIADGALDSAGVIVPLVKEEFGVQSVLDVGCGAGAWLKVWSDWGIDDYMGLDGADVEGKQLLVPADRFQKRDLSKPWDLGRRFDLAQCMEVAEHLPCDASATLVQCLTQHADIVMFSAAPPGQGGQHHVNEQPYEYWHQLFTENNYIGCDWIRPWVRNHSEVEPWYRYNSLLYVRKPMLELSPTLRHSALKPGQAIEDIAPPLYRIRRRLLAKLPPRALTQFAVLKKHATLGRRKLSR